MARSRTVQSSGGGAATSVHDRIVAEIRSARLAAGLTQKELAARLKKSPSWVAAAEHGRRRIFVHDLASIAVALGIDPIELLSRAKERAK
jgi:transcriptional regulator with XRE-family HTH domain